MGEEAAGLRATTGPRRGEKDAARPRASTHVESTEGELLCEGLRPTCRSVRDRPSERATQTYEVIAGQRAW